ncbi:sugar phosphate isomerase/epimerase family protein [Arthrobacter subterraneus]|uniref:sugar phosphate isomerase/epimerase family protein n=1 Tax=Arthrobacter subterraneus TaxID=335973 RepID=UPI0037F9F028
MKYSLQLYTLRTAMGEDLPGTIKRIADLGYSAVEPYNFVATADELAEALSANGLTAPSGHAPLLRADLDDIFRAAKRLDIGTVIDPHVDRSHWTSIEDITATAEALNAAAKKGAEYGITVGYHNHEFELEAQIDDKSGLEILADHLDPEVVLEVDTYWAAVGGEDPAALLRRLGDRVRFVHIKDGPLTRNDKEQVAVGSGRMPVWDILHAATGIEAAVIELDDFDGDMFTAVADSLNYLNEGKK